MPWTKRAGVPSEGALLEGFVVRLAAARGTQAWSHGYSGEGLASTSTMYPYGYSGEGLASTFTMYPLFRRGPCLHIHEVPFPHCTARWLNAALYARHTPHGVQNGQSAFTISPSMVYRRAWCRRAALHLRASQPWYSAAVLPSGMQTQANLPIRGRLMP